MRLLAAAVLLVQSPVSLAPSAHSPALRAGLDTLYGGRFAEAAAHFATRAAADTTDPAPLIFQAGAYIWWAAAQDSVNFERSRIDSLLGAAIRRARTLAKDSAVAGDFWLATALGYRARERELHGHGLGAARDAKAMRDAYARVLAADSSCIDCYLGLGLYNYGLARASFLARLFARLIGLGSGNVETAFRYMHRVAAEGDLARIEGTWVLAAALMREAARAPVGGARDSLAREARGYVVRLAERYPANPLFLRFLTEVPATSPPPTP